MSNSCIDPLREHFLVLPFRVKVDLGAMAMKGYYIFLEPLNHLIRTESKLNEFVFNKM